MTNKHCPSCSHSLKKHELEDGEVWCNQQIDEGGGYQVDCWICELTQEEFIKLSEPTCSKCGSRMRRWLMFWKCVSCGNKE